MNFRRIRAIIHKDFIEALRNKTILIAIFLPLAASLSLAVIDSAQRPQFFQIGITGEASYPMGIFLMASAGDNLHITPYDGVAEGTEAVKQGKADALILAESEGQFRVYADGTNPLAYLSLKELLETLLSAYVGRPSEPVLELVLVNEGQASTSVLPLWLTITTVMIGVMILSGSFSEEKEKGTLDNIRISPTADGEILISKGISGALLILLVSFAMLLLNGVSFHGKGMLLGCILLLALGAISFTSIGLLIGLLTKTQSAARAISTIVYFPLIYPAMAADIAPSTQHLAKVLPSFYLYRGLREILNYQSPITTIKPDIIGLVIFAIIFFGATLLGYRAVLHRDS